jgi:hypothetical protein
MIDIGLKFTKSAYITPNFVCKKSEFYAEFKLVDRGLKKCFDRKVICKASGKCAKTKILKFRIVFYYEFL